MNHSHAPTKKGRYDDCFLFAAMRVFSLEVLVSKNWMYLSPRTKCTPHQVRGSHTNEKVYDICVWIKYIPHGYSFLIFTITTTV